VTIDGVRAGDDARADLTIATALELERRSAARVGSEGYVETNGRWAATDSAGVSDDLALDDRLLATALNGRNRSAAEFHGEEYVEGARGRRCRTAVDGRTFLRAFPATSFLVGSADLHRWRGELDYWIFADGAVGRVSGSINGDAAGLPGSGVLGTVHVLMTIVDRGRAISIQAPALP
jgi:hypothetical protein